MYMTCVKNPYFTGVVENQVSNSRIDRGDNLLLTPFQCNTFIGTCPNTDRTSQAYLFIYLDFFLEFDTCKPLFPD